jgi:hypothetical protein
MVAGQPLGIEEHERCASPHGNGFPDREETPIEISRVDVQADRARVGDVPGDLHGWGQGHRLRRRNLRLQSGAAQ